MTGQLRAGLPELRNIVLARDDRNGRRVKTEASQGVAQGVLRPGGACENNPAICRGVRNRNPELADWEDDRWKPRPVITCTAPRTRSSRHVATARGCVLESTVTVAAIVAGSPLAVPTALQGLLLVSFSWRS